MKIGFIGLGIMGSRMAANLLDNDYEVIVFNRSKDKAERLIEKGAEWGGSIEKTAENSDILISMVSTPKAVGDIAFSDDGIIANMKKDTLWINSSTINPSFAELTAMKAVNAGIRYLDAPVLGSLKQAEARNLIFLIGGNKDDVDENDRLFKSMGKSIVIAGGYGAGSSLKMVVNMMMGYVTAGFSEAMHLGEALGLSRDSLLDILPKMPVVPPFIQGKIEKIKNSEYSPEFPLKWAHKDLHLACISAYEKEISLLGANAVKEIFAQAKQRSMGDSDMSRVYEYITQKM